MAREREELRRQQEQLRYEQEKRNNLKRGREVEHGYVHSFSFFLTEVCGGSDSQTGIHFILAV